MGVLNRGAYINYKHCLKWCGLPHEEQKLELTYIKKLIAEENAWMLQNCYHWDCGFETNFWYIIKDSYDATLYSKKVRKYIQKAHNKFEIGLIAKQKLIDEGYDVYLSNYAKYRVHDGFKDTRQTFEKRIEQMNDEHEIWGCIDKETGKLEAYSICRIGDDVCYFESSKANPEFLTKYYPFYGMYDARNKYYIVEKGLKYCVSGARSVSEHSKIQQFLIEKLHFRKAYCQMDIHYVWWMSVLVKILYPFRNYIKIGKVQSLLNMEAIVRGDK